MRTNMRWHIRYSSLISIRMHSQQLFFFLPTNDENKIFPFVDNAITAQCSCIALPFIRSHQPFASYFALQSPCADLRSALYFPFFLRMLIRTLWNMLIHSENYFHFAFFSLRLRLFLCIWARGILRLNWVSNLWKWWISKQKKTWFAL